MPYAMFGITTKTDRSDIFFKVMQPNPIVSFNQM